MKCIKRIQPHSDHLLGSHFSDFVHVSKFRISFARLLVFTSILSSFSRGVAYPVKMLSTFDTYGFSYGTIRNQKSKVLHIQNVQTSLQLISVDLKVNCPIIYSITVKVAFPHPQFNSFWRFEEGAPVCLSTVLNTTHRAAEPLSL